MSVSSFDFVPRQLDRDLVDELKDLGLEAEKTLGVGGPATEAVWTARTAGVLAEAGDVVRASTLLTRARKAARQIGDPYSVDSTCSELGSTYCRVGYALNDDALFRIGLEILGNVSDGGSRCLGMSRVFRYLEGRGSRRGASRIKTRLLEEVESLLPFSFALVLSDFVPTLSKSRVADQEVDRLLDEALRRSKKDDILGNTTLRDIAELFGQTARDRRDETLMKRACGIIDEMDDEGLIAGVLGGIATGWAEMGAFDHAARSLDRQRLLVDAVEDAWDRRIAQRQFLESAAVVAAAAKDERLSAEVERRIGEIEKSDRNLAMMFVVSGLARYAERNRDVEAARKALEYDRRINDLSARYEDPAPVARALAGCGLMDEATEFITRARTWSEGVREPLDRCRVMIGIAEAMLETRLVPARHHA